MTTLRIGGVPEHFNLPWHLCIENKKFEKAGLDVQWKEIPEGTGKMCQDLRNNDLDVAIILTEGITKDIIDGNPVKIVQEYIGSPLIWGIHVSKESKYKELQDLKGTTAAISRLGSGSHLMAYVNAQHQNWEIDELQFEIVNNVDGAIKALHNDDAQYFMWEHFTTKPLVDNDTFRLVADCPTPWPCFVIAVREEFLESNAKEIRNMLKVINTETKEFKLQPRIDEILAERYGQKLEDIRKWLDLTRWSQNQISENEINEVMDQLVLLNIIQDKKTPEEILWK